MTAGGVKICMGCSNPAEFYIRYHYAHEGVIVSAGGATVCAGCLAAAAAAAVVIVDRVPLSEAVTA